MTDCDTDRDAATWTLQEDVRLAMHTRQHGSNRWTELCQHLPGKTADDCCSRSEALNLETHGRPAAPWTPLESSLVAQMARQQGITAAAVARFIPGRRVADVVAYCLQSGLGQQLLNAAAAAGPAQGQQQQPSRLPQSLTSSLQAAQQQQQQQSLDVQPTRGMSGMKRAASDRICDAPDSAAPRGPSLITGRTAAATGQQQQQNKKARIPAAQGGGAVGSATERSRQPAAAGTSSMRGAPSAAGDGDCVTPAAAQQGACKQTGDKAHPAYGLASDAAAADGVVPASAPAAVAGNSGRVQDNGCIPNAKQQQQQQQQQQQGVGVPGSPASATSSHTYSSSGSANSPHVAAAVAAHGTAAAGAAAATVAVGSGGMRSGMGRTGSLAASMCRPTGSGFGARGVAEVAAGTRRGDALITASTAAAGDAGEGGQQAPPPRPVLAAAATTSREQPPPLSLGAAALTPDSDGSAAAAAGAGSSGRQPSGNVHASLAPTTGARSAGAAAGAGLKAAGARETTLRRPDGNQAKCAVPPARSSSLQAGGRAVAAAAAAAPAAGAATATKGRGLGAGGAGVEQQQQQQQQQQHRDLPHPGLQQQLQQALSRLPLTMPAAMGPNQRTGPPGQAAAATRAIPAAAGAAAASKPRPHGMGVAQGATAAAAVAAAMARKAAAAGRGLPTAAATAAAAAGAATASAARPTTATAAAAAGAGAAAVQRPNFAIEALVAASGLDTSEAQFWLRQLLLGAVANGAQLDAEPGTPDRAGEASRLAPKGPSQALPAAARHMLAALPAAGGGQGGRGPAASAAWGHLANPITSQSPAAAGGPKEGGNRAAAGAGAEGKAPPSAPTGLAAVAVSRAQAAGMTKQSSLQEPLTPQLQQQQQQHLMLLSRMQQRQQASAPAAGGSEPWSGRMGASQGQKQRSRLQSVAVPAPAAAAAAGGGGVSQQQSVQWQWSEQQQQQQQQQQVLAQGPSATRLVHGAAADLTASNLPPLQHISAGGRGAVTAAAGGHMAHSSAPVSSHVTNIGASHPAAPQVVSLPIGQGAAEPLAAFPQQVAAAAQRNQARQPLAAAAAAASTLKDSTGAGMSFMQLLASSDECAGDGEQQIPSIEQSGSMPGAPTGLLMTVQRSSNQFINVLGGTAAWQQQQQQQLQHPPGAMSPPGLLDPSSGVMAANMSPQLTWVNTQSPVCAPVQQQQQQQQQQQKQQQRGPLSSTSAMTALDSGIVVGGSSSPALNVGRSSSDSQTQQQQQHQHPGDLQHLQQALPAGSVVVVPSTGPDGQFPCTMQLQYSSTVNGLSWQYVDLASAKQLVEVYMHCPAQAAHQQQQQQQQQRLHGSPAGLLAGASPTPPALSCQQLGCLAMSPSAAAGASPVLISPAGAAGDAARDMYMMQQQHFMPSTLPGASPGDTWGSVQTQAQPQQQGGTTPGLPQVLGCITAPGVAANTPGAEQAVLQGGLEQQALQSPAEGLALPLLGRSGSLGLGLGDGLLAALPEGALTMLDAEEQVLMSELFDLW